MSNHGDDERGPTAMVQSVDRAIAVLELLANGGEAGITEHPLQLVEIEGVVVAAGLPLLLGFQALGPSGKFLERQGSASVNLFPAGVNRDVPAIPVVLDVI